MLGPLGLGHPLLVLVLLVPVEHGSLLPDIIILAVRIQQERAFIHLITMELRPPKSEIGEQDQSVTSLKKKITLCERRDHVWNVPHQSSVNAPYRFVAEES